MMYCFAPFTWNGLLSLISHVPCAWDADGIPMLMTAPATTVNIEAFMPALLVSAKSIVTHQV